MGLLQSLVFRPPNPATYTKDGVPGDIHFVATSLGSTIPVCVDLPFHKRKSFHRTSADQRWILFSHGNAEDLGNVTLWTSMICDATNMAVVSYDYSGYGLSTLESRNDAQESSIELSVPPKPSEASLYADCEAVLEFAEKHLGLKRENAVLWGRSLGCCASIHLALLCKSQEQAVAGIILQCPFTSVIEVGLNMHLEQTPTQDMFRNYDKLKQAKGFDAPTFVIHGMNDWIVNWWHGREMAELIPNDQKWPPLFVPCGHNDLEASYHNFLNEILDFVRFCDWRLDPLT